MGTKGLNPVVRAVLGAVAGFAIFMGIHYVREVLVDGASFTPRWGEAVLTGVLVGLLTYFGPDAAQRRRNRQNLKETFTDSFGKKG